MQTSDVEDEGAIGPPNGEGEDVYFLRVVKSPSLGKGERFILDAEDISIGRPENGAGIGIPNDFGVSGRHANIHRDGSRLVIFDMDSVSGVFINGKPISHGHYLKPGDKLRIGDTEFSFHKTRRRADSGRGWWMEPDIIVLTLVVLALIGGAVYYHFNPSNAFMAGNANSGQSIGVAVDPVFPDNQMDWRSLSLPEDVIPIENMEKAQMYYRQAMLCYRSKTLDLRNAFSAIVAMKRLKSCLPYEANPMDLPFPFENIDKAILGSQDYMDYHRKRFINGYIRARNIGDYDAAIKCLENYKLLFIDKFSKVHAKEYVQGDNELRWLYSIRGK